MDIDTLLVGAPIVATTIAVATFFYQWYSRKVAQLKEDTISEITLESLSQEVVELVGNIEKLSEILSTRYAPLERLHTLEGEIHRLRDEVSKLDDDVRQDVSKLNNELMSKIDSSIKSLKEDTQQQLQMIIQLIERGFR